MRKRGEYFLSAKFASKYTHKMLKYMLNSNNSYKLYAYKLRREEPTVKEHSMQHKKAVIFCRKSYFMTNPVKFLQSWLWFKIQIFVIIWDNINNQSTPVQESFI